MDVTMSTEETQTLGQNDVKLSDQEIEAIERVRGQNAELVIRLGNTKIKQINARLRVEALEKEEQDLEDEIQRLWKEEEDIVETIKEKYGDGWLYPQQGIFKKKPTEEKDQSSQ